MDEKKSQRGLSGIYFFEDKTPTCFEDCSLQNQNRILLDMDQETMRNLCIALADTLHLVADKFNIVKGTEEEAKQSKKDYED